MAQSKEAVLPATQDAHEQWSNFETVFTNAKAGMAGVDKEHVKRIVYEMSKVHTGMPSCCYLLYVASLINMCLCRTLLTSKMSRESKLKQTLAYRKCEQKQKR